MKPSGILEVDPETLEAPLTDDQKAEVETFKDGINWDADSKPDDKPAEKLEEKNPEEKKPEETPKEAEKEEKEGGEPEEKAPEGEKKPDEKEEKPEPKKDEKTPEQLEVERLETIAKDEGLTVDEVKESEAKDKSVVENYSGDVNKMAKALRKENSAYGKLKSENDELKEYKQTTEAEKAQYSEKKIDTYLEKNKEGFIEKYIKQNPDEADVNDDVLFERVKALIKQNLKAKQAESATEFQKEADKAREKLITELPEEYKDFVPEIKGILKQEGNDVVLAKDFDIMNLAHWARGKKFTPEYVKFLEDAAHKRGHEQPEIKEKKAAITSSGDRGSTVQRAVVVASPHDCQRAVEIYGNKEGWSEEQMIEEYVKTHKQHDNWD